MWHEIPLLVSKNVESDVDCRKTFLRFSYYKSAYVVFYLFKKYYFKVFFKRKTTDSEVLESIWS